MFVVLFYKNKKGNPARIKKIKSRKSFFMKFKYNTLIINTICFIFFLPSTTKISAQNIDDFKKDSVLERKYFQEGSREGKKGDFEKAEELLKKSVVIGEKIYGGNNNKIISTYINLGIQQKNLGKYDEALESYFTAEKLIKNIYGENDSRLGMVYGNAGIIYKLKGDHARALEFHESALRAFSSDSVKFEQRINITQFNLAVTLVNLNRINDAKKIIIKHIKGKSDEITPKYYDLLANISKGRGELKDAIVFYKKAIGNWIKYSGTNNYSLGEEYTNYADLLVKLGSYDSAEYYNKEAEKIIRNTYGPKSVYYSDIQNIYGDIYLNRDSQAGTIKDFKEKKKSNISKALSYYQKAAVAVIENYETKDPYALPPTDNVISDMQLLTVLKKKANAFELLAEICQSEMDYDNFLRFNISALHTISTCTNLIHRLRIGYLTEESKLLLAEKQESTFMNAISIACRLYRFTKEKQYLSMAYEFTEKSKSANFLASVKDMEAKEFGGIPDSLLSKEQYLKINISNYRELLFQENQQEKPDTQKTNLYSQKLFQHNEEYNQLIGLFEQKYPKYYSFKYENKVISIDEIQRKLNKKEAIIEYVIDAPADSIHPGQLYRFTITKNNVDLSVDNINYSDVGEIEFLYTFLSSSNYLLTNKKGYADYCISANRLYNKLISPVTKQISGKHLTIIPDDKLAYIPFDALISEMPDTSEMDFRNLKYLIYDYPISYSYSSTLLFNYFETEKHVSKRLLAFAPDYDSDKNSNGETFRPLPGAKEEVNSLKDYISSDIYTDSLATESLFKKLAPKYDILHLAMHTIVNDSLPMFSKLVFSMADKKDSDDGWLNTYEIYNMKLNARMAVLSACNTGTGKLQKGEGVMSLARGFLYAGCPSIIMTLWEVEDLSGTEIMRNFYDYISQGKDKDDALRLAKLKHIKNADPLKAHPHYWLGYVNIGNPEALYNNKDIYFIIIILLVLTAIFIDQGYRYRKNRKRFK